MRGRLEAHLDHLNIRGRRGEIVWVNPSSKCASCHSNEMHRGIIHTHVNVSLKAYVYDETIYNSCARARFTGCTYLRHIILAINTVRNASFRQGHQQEKAQNQQQKRQQQDLCGKAMKVAVNGARLWL
jgi:hypothetical protein